VQWEIPHCVWNDVASPSGKQLQINIQNIDNAEAVGEQSDEEFAQSLQVAEFIKAGLKPR